MLFFFVSETEITHIISGNVYTNTDAYIRYSVAGCRKRQINGKSYSVFSNAAVNFIFGVMTKAALVRILIFLHNCCTLYEL